jgi:hypothetical protein
VDTLIGDPFHQFRRGDFQSRPGIGLETLNLSE